jgi:hypothetical protein
MDTVLELEEILGRLERCPLNLVRVELDMFYNALQRNVYLITLLTDILQRNEEALGAKAASIVSDIRSSTWADLEFANSAALRAAVGYQVCECLLGERKAIMCGKKVIHLGERYAAYQGIHKPSEADAIRVFSEVFLHPLVSYLRGALEIQDQVVLLLSRYKQRSEWFPDEGLIKAAQDNTRRLENRLKKDFLRYLFDNGMVFSVESQAPPGGGEADVLPLLPDVGPLPIEVKVFDGKSRNQSYISRGLAQAGDYARRFNSAYACYIVYNVAENTILELPGTATASNVIRTSVAGVDVLSIVANVCITLPASQASNLNRVSIPAPSALSQ